MRYFLLALLFSISSGTTCFGQNKVEVLEKLDAEIASLKAVKDIKLLLDPDTIFVKIVQRISENEALVEELFPDRDYHTYIYLKGPNSQWKDDQVIEVLNRGWEEDIDFKTQKGLKKVRVLVSTKGTLQKSFELYRCRKEAARIMYSNFYDAHRKKIYVYNMRKGNRKGKKLSKYRAEVRTVWIPGSVGTSFYDKENDFRYGKNYSGMDKPYATDDLKEWFELFGRMQFATVRNDKEVHIYSVGYDSEDRLSQSTIEFVDELYKGSYSIWEKYQIVPDGRLFDYKATTRDDGKTYGGRSGWKLDVSEGMR